MSLIAQNLNNVNFTYITENTYPTIVSLIHLAILKNLSITVVSATSTEHLFIPFVRLDTAMLMLNV